MTVKFRVLEQDIHSYGSLPNEMYDAVKGFSHISEFQDEVNDLVDDEGYLLNSLHTYTCCLENDIYCGGNDISRATNIIWELFQQVIFQSGPVKTLDCHTEVETIEDFAGMKRVAPVSNEEIKNAVPVCRE